MICRDTVAKHHQHARAGYVFDRLRGGTDAFEERWCLDISRAFIPLEQIPARHLQLSPAFIAFKNMAVLLAEHRRIDKSGDRSLYLLDGRPDVAQVNRLALGIARERL